MQSMGTITCRAVGKKRRELCCVLRHRWAALECVTGCATLAAACQDAGCICRLSKVLLHPAGPCQPSPGSRAGACVMQPQHSCCGVRIVARVAWLQPSPGGTQDCGRSAALRSMARHAQSLHVRALLPATRAPTCGSL